MATTGESANKWLTENQDKVSSARIEQIRNNIAEKLARLDESDDSYPGLLEALDVMDQHLQAKEQPAEPTASLDLGPLVADPSDDIPKLDEQEKQARFRQLLTAGKL